MKIRFVILALLLFCVTNNTAEITFNLDVEALKDADGSRMPTTGLVILAASTLNSIFTAPTPDQFFSGDDIELARWDLSGFNEPGYLNDTTGPLSLSGDWNANDAVQLYWFPSLTLSSTSPGGGTSYGTYRHDTGLDGSQPWFTPADGTPVWSLNFFTADANVFHQGGQNPAFAGEANLTVVPEPSHYAMACGLICLGYAVVSRKLRRAAF